MSIINIGRPTLFNKQNPNHGDGKPLEESNQRVMIREPNPAALDK